MTSSILRFHDQSPIPQLSVDLVIGHIRWHKSLGLPDGNIRNAFSFLCYHYEMQPIHGGSALDEKPVKSFHNVDAWEGPNDDENYRVSFITDAQEPSGYRPEDKNPIRYQNFLEVSFHHSMLWKNPPQTLSGIKVLTPQQIIFNLPGQPQLLPDINIINIHLINYRQ